MDQKVEKVRFGAVVLNAVVNGFADEMNHLVELDGASFLAPRHGVVHDSLQTLHSVFNIEFFD